MKACLLFIVLLAALAPLHAFAQDNREDVIYMKNGSVYHGTILSQEYGYSYKIRIAGGSVIVLKADEVQKVVKAGKSDTSAGPDANLRRRRVRPIKVRGPYFYQDKGFFFQLLPEVGLLDGVRLISGYRFNQYAALGLGIGTEYDAKVSTTNAFAETVEEVSGTQAGYFPIFLSLQGDMLKGPIVPFYTVEGGYTICLTPYITSSASDDYYSYGPPSAYYTWFNRGGGFCGVGVGAHFYTPKRVTISLSANCDFEYLPYTYTESYPTASGSGAWKHWMPSGRIGIGF